MNAPRQNRRPLCAPQDTASCFRCCPPIRPAHYDHHDYRHFLRRELGEQTRALRRIPGDPPAKAIVGFTCWGLGFLDDTGGRVGCLLHPAHNHGRDLRDLTGYGDKCRREWCPEARVYQALSDRGAALVLGLADGLNAFGFSSPRVNRAWRLLNWGPAVVDALAAVAPHGYSLAAYQRECRPLDRDLDPGLYAYPLTRLLALAPGPSSPLEPETAALLPRIVAPFFAAHRRPYQHDPPNRPFAHQVAGDPLLARFLSRLGYARATTAQVRFLTTELDAVLQGCLPPKTVD